MLYFLGWVVFLAGVVLSVPIAAFIEKRRREPRPLPAEPEPEEAPSVEAVVETELPQTEDELEKRLRRLRLISEGMTQEEMFAHAQATMELATMLQENGQLVDAGRALDILVNQPGIGDRYLIRSLTKHISVSRQLGEESKVPQAMTDLQETVARTAQDNPELLTDVQSELTPDELQILAAFV